MKIKLLEREGEGMREKGERVMKDRKDRNGNEPLKLQAPAKKKNHPPRDNGEQESLADWKLSRRNKLEDGCKEVQKRMQG